MSYKRKEQYSSSSSSSDDSSDDDAPLEFSAQTAKVQFQQQDEAAKTFLKQKELEKSKKQEEIRQKQLEVSRNRALKEQKKQQRQEDDEDDDTSVQLFGLTDSSAGDIDFDPVALKAAAARQANIQKEKEQFDLKVQLTEANKLKAAEKDRLHKANTIAKLLREQTAVDNKERVKKVSGFKVKAQGPTGKKQALSAKQRLAMARIDVINTTEPPPPATILEKAPRIDRNSDPRIVALKTRRKY